VATISITEKLIASGAATASTDVKVATILVGMKLAN